MKHGLRFINPGDIHELLDGDTVSITANCDGSFQIDGERVVPHFYAPRGKGVVSIMGLDARNANNTAAPIVRNSRKAGIDWHKVAGLALMAASVAFVVWLVFL